MIQQIEELKSSIELLKQKRELEAQLKFKRASSIETLSLNISNLEEQVASKDHEIKRSSSGLAQAFLFHL